MGRRAAIAVVTARNEGDRISKTVRGLLEIPEISSVIVVDDGSTDGTSEDARAAGATILRGWGMGKGDALEAVLDRVGMAEVYVLADGDLGGSAPGLRPLLEPVLAGRADLAVGVLPAPPTGGFGLVKSFAARLVEEVAGSRPTEPLSGQRAVTRECLWACRPLARGFGLESAMTADALRLGFGVEEIPVQLDHRFGRKDLAGFVHRGRQGADILRALLPRMAAIR
jgi:glucosyl-3-phosphoglycerate synthase